VLYHGCQDSAPATLDANSSQLQAMSTTSDFSLFTSLRYDPILLSSRENIAASGLSIQSPLYLLSFNRDRMLAAATHFNWPGSATTVLQDLSEFNHKLLDAVETYFHGHRGERTPLKVYPSIIHPASIRG